MSGFTAFFRRLSMIAPILALLVSAPISAAYTSPARVLVLHSYHHGFTWTDSVQRGIESAFADADLSAELVIEEMDAKRHPGNKLFRVLETLYDSKYNTWQPRVIISCDDDALAFLFKHRDTLFPGVPVVFCGLNVEDYDPSRFAGRNGYTGVVERLDFASTLDVILRLQPETRRVVFIHDRTRSGLADRETIEQLAPAYAGRLKFLFPDTGEGIGEAELTAGLRNLPADSAVYFLGFFRDRSGKPLALADILPRISEASPVPVYSHAEAYLGSGILGGKLLSGEVHGRSAAQTAIRLLRGATADQTPVRVESSNRYMFDYRQLKRFNIPESRLPAGSIIAFKPASFFHRHRTALIWSLVGAAALILFTAYLLILTIRLRRTEKKLAAEEQHYRLLADHAADVIFTLDLNLRYTYVSPSVESLRGYTPTEVMGQTMDILLTPASYENAKRALTEQLRIDGEKNADPERSVNLELEMIRKDRSRFWAEVKCSFLRDAEGNPRGVLGVTRDITDRKQMMEALRRSEENYREMFRHSIAAMFRSTPRGRFVTCNFAFARLFGYDSPEDVISEITDIPRQYYVNPQDRLRYMQILREKGFVEKYEFQARRKDGAVIWITNSTRVIRDQEGEILYYEGIVSDITERKRAEAALERSEREKSLILNTTKEMIAYYKTTDLKIYWANKESGRVVGVDPETLSGRCCYEVWQDRFDPCEDCPVLETFQTGKPVEMERSTPDGKLWLLRSYPVFEQGVLEGVIELGLNITERKQAETEKAELEAKNRRLQKAESLARMAGAVAHHFNNQLSVVIGNLELAMEEVPGETAPLEKLTPAMQAARRAADMSGLMLTYLGQSSGRTEPLDLSTVSRAILSTLPGPEGAVSLKTDIPNNGPVVSADADQLRKVLTHLVENAREAVGEGPGAVTLAIKTISAGEIQPPRIIPIDWTPAGDAFACVEVSDTGSGMTEPVMEQVFDPFFTTKFPGRGLGLAVVLGIVRAWGGAIGFESRPDAGSVFRVFLPAISKKPPTSPAPPAARTSQTAGGTVLLVEDQEMVRHMAEAMLKRLGYTVYTAASGRAALSLFREKQQEITCVITDLTMPDMDGWETLNAIRRLSPEIPVILASGYDAADVMAGAQLEKPQAFLHKPYLMTDLKQALREAGR